MESSEATQAQLSESIEPRITGRIPRCQVEGCDADLLADKRYCVRKKVCSGHMQADVVCKRNQPDQEWRFCFQCGKLEPLELFDGRQRSCRDRLVMRRKPKRSNSAFGAVSHKGDASNHKRCRTAEAECSYSTDMHSYSYSEWEQQQQQQAMWMMQQQGMYGRESWYTEQQDCSFSDSWYADQQALQQQQLLSARAAIAAQGADLMRTSTGVSASGVAAALLAQQQHMAVSAANTQAVAGAAGVKCENLEAAGVQQEVMALQQQCQQLQYRLQKQLSSMQAATPAASAPAAVRCAERPGATHSAAAAATFPAAAGVPVRCAERPVASTPATAAMQATTPQQDAGGMDPAAAAAEPAAALQRAVSLGTPRSPDSAATAITTASHMQLVEMVVAQLEDPCVSAEANELEAFLERELRMAATTPRPCAQQIWAYQLNDVINDLTSAITCSAIPSAQPTPSSSFALRAGHGSAAAAGTASVATASAGGVLGMQIGPDSVSQQMLRAAVPAKAAVTGDGLFDERLRSLQHQLVHLQSMVKDLRTQVFA